MASLATSKPYVGNESRAYAASLYTGVSLTEESIACNPVGCHFIRPTLSSRQAYPNLTTTRACQCAKKLQMANSWLTNHPKVIASVAITWVGIQEYTITGIHSCQEFAYFIYGGLVEICWQMKSNIVQQLV